MLVREISATATIRSRSNGGLHVIAPRASGCKQCAQQFICAGDHDSVHMQLPLPQDKASSYAEGDAISIAMSGDQLLKLILLCYMLPAGLMLAGALLFASMSEAYYEIAAIWGALLG